MTSNTTYEVLVVPHEVSVVPHEVSVVPHEVSVVPPEVSVVPHEVFVVPHEVTVSFTRPLEAGAASKWFPGACTASNTDFLKLN
jgi:hypothetical protein